MASFFLVSCYLPAAAKLKQSNSKTLLFGNTGCHGNAHHIPYPLLADRNCNQNTEFEMFSILDRCDSFGGGMTNHQLGRKYKADGDVFKGWLMGIFFFF